LGDVTASTEVKLLFAAWTEWSGAAGEGAMSVKRFSQALANRGLHRGKHHTTRRAVFEGVRLLSSMAP
jgi:phage/plasmid-associated DNA primase